MKHEPLKLSFCQMCSQQQDWMSLTYPNPTLFMVLFTTNASSGTLVTCSNANIYWRQTIPWCRHFSWNLFVSGRKWFQAKIISTDMIATILYCSLMVVTYIYSRFIYFYGLVSILSENRPSINLIMYSWHKLIAFYSIFFYLLNTLQKWDKYMSVIACHFTGPSTWSG